MTFPIMLLSTIASAHPSASPPVQHAAEHLWLLLAVPLLLGLPFLLHRR
ncbi:MAG: hypothetical protein H6953_05460 [Chromatiaceae bacterium]|nr:hypothetical protein [Chromatiaceae bacterium]MCP5314830.1 hypothetical protein [Chromatiaceae bacterium]